ncbi:hypothetical protein D1007_54103 [Hordeum vulgare]|nr:hypothetical protein D1007_54103 [Hordeum vulgare]
MRSGADTPPDAAASAGTGELLGATSDARPKRAPVGDSLVSPHHHGLQFGTRTGAAWGTRPGMTPLGVRWERLQARGLAALGMRRPTFPGVLHETRREYRRPDYINPWRRARFDDDRTSIRPGYGGSSADHHRNKRHARDPAGSPRANMCE